MLTSTDMPPYYSTQPLPDSQHSAPQIGKEVRIILRNSFEDAACNVIRLSSGIYNYFFSSLSDRSGFIPYVKVGNYIYKAKLDQAMDDVEEKNLIGLNQAQKIDVSNDIVQNKLWIAPWFDAKSILKLKMIKVEISKYPYGNFPLRSKCRDTIFQIEALRRKIKVVLDEQIIAAGQVFIFEMNGEHLQLMVTTKGSTEEILKSIYGKVDSNTRVEFILKNAKAGITIIDKLINNPEGTCIFGIKVPSRLADPQSPFIIPTSILKEKLFFKEECNNLLLHEKIRIDINDNKQLILIFERFIDGEDDYNDSKDVNQKKGAKLFRLDSQQNIIFRRINKSHVILTNKDPVESKIVEFDITAIKDKAGEENRGYKLDWIDAHEILDILASLNKPLCHQQKITIPYKNKNINCTLLKACAFNPFFKKDKQIGKILWQITKNTDIRLSCRAELNMPVVISDRPYPLAKISFKVLPRTMREGYRPKLEIRENELLQAIKEQIIFPLIVGQVLNLTLENYPVVKIYVDSFTFETKEESGMKFDKLGKMHTSTLISVVPECEEVIIASKPLVMKFDPVKQLEEHHLAGLSEKFHDIMKKIFMQYLMPDEFKARGLKPVKGLILHGQPGCGKSQLAKSLASILDCTKENHRLILVNGPELYNMWVGKSENNVRKLFDIPRNDKNNNYVIFFDEADQLFQVRSEDTSKVANSVVNQLLNCMDGPNTPSNVIFIATTNRFDRIDPAFKRPGRFDEIFQVMPPNKNERIKIFEVLTKELKEKKILDETFNAKALAEMTNNCTGADIKWIVTEASNYSLDRLYNLQLPEKDLKERQEGKIKQKDFIHAIEKMNERNIQDKDKVPDIYS